MALFDQLPISRLVCSEYHGDSQVLTPGQICCLRRIHVGRMRIFGGELRNIDMYQAHVRPDQSSAGLDYRDLVLKSI